MSPWKRPLIIRLSSKLSLPSKLISSASMVTMSLSSTSRICTSDISSPVLYGNPTQRYCTCQVSSGLILRFEHVQGVLERLEHGVAHLTGIGIVALQIVEELQRVVTGLFDNLEELAVSHSRYAA